MIQLLAGTYYHGFVSDIEILWVLIALFGAGFSIHNLRESFMDITALRLSGIRNGRWKIARAALKSESARLFIQLIYIMVGIGAMTFQEPPVQYHQPLHIQIFTFLFQWGFILSSAMLTAISYWNFALRRDLLESGIRIEPHEMAYDRYDDDENTDEEKK